MHSCEDFILAIRRNFMHMEGSGTIAELSAHDIGLGAGDDFEILLGGAGDEPNRVPLPDGALSVSIREYYFDWQPREPATFTIECLDADSPPGPFTSDALAIGLEEAATHLHRSLTYWNQYMLDARAGQRDNEFGGGYDVKRGLAAAKYAFCFFDLAPDEALVVDCDIPDSRYWSFHLYNLAWWEALEYATRVTTLNHTQTRISDDGRIRVVVAHEDPGVPNWLDTEGRREALLTLRWFWPDGRPAVTVDPRGEAGRRAGGAARRHAHRRRRRAPRRDQGPPRPHRLALPHLSHAARRRLAGLRRQDGCSGSTWKRFAGSYRALSRVTALVVVAVGGLNPILAFVHHEVHVGPDPWSTGCSGVEVVDRSSRVIASRVRRDQGRRRP